MKQTIKTISILAIMVASLNVFALDNKEQVGTIVGGIVGGVVGNQIGGGNGVATVIGVIAGAAIGNSIGSSLDKLDRMALRDAQRDALVSPVGTPINWYGSEYGSQSGAYGQFATTRRGYHRQYVNEECRSYRSEIRSRGKTEVRTGNTCRRSDGSWHEVKTSEVFYY